MHSAAIERIIANTINETARGDPDALAARIVAALAEAGYRILPPHGRENAAPRPPRPVGPPLQAGPGPKALPPARRMAGAADLVAPAPQVALLRLANVATQSALRRVRACELGCDDPFHRHSASCVFVKAGCGKTARPVCNCRTHGRGAVVKPAIYGFLA
jgi:hypothetical protein